jgi:hypothetical protein
MTDEGLKSGPTPSKHPSWCDPRVHRQMGDPDIHQGTIRTKGSAAAWLTTTTRDTMVVVDLAGPTQLPLIEAEKFGWDLIDLAREGRGLPPTQRASED